LGSEGNRPAWILINSYRPEDLEKKIDAVLKMEAPKILKELRGFIRMVNYYWDIWPHRAHILAPLMSQTGVPQIG
jgi:hypothetical protein